MVPRASGAGATWQVARVPENQGEASPRPYPCGIRVALFPLYNTLT